MLLIISSSGGQLNRYYQIVKSSEKITLVEGEEIINEDGENTERLNTFFSNAVKNIHIPEY